MSDEPTTNELGRRFDRLESSIDRGFAEVKEQLNRTVSTDVFGLYQSSTERRFEQVEAKVGKVEEDRATDRRALAKLVAVWAGVILAAISTATGILSLIGG